jgi:hypothetical protein
LSVVIHIGYHKTGTTWFQKRFYPRVTSHRYIDRERVRHAFIEDTAFRFDPERVDERLGVTPGEKLILCEEGLSGYLHNGGLMGHFSKAMAERLHAAFPQATIVLFVRSQPEMIASCYQQYVRGGGTHPPQRYLFPDLYLHGAASEAHRIPRFCFDLFDYLPLIETYVALFGPERVRVYPFEAMKAGGADFLRGFADDLGLEVDVEAVVRERENGSYALPLIPLARVLNLFTYRTVADKRCLVHIPYWYTVRRALLEALNRTGLFGKPPSARRLLGDGIVDWIRERFWEGNSELARRYALPLADYGYPIAKPNRAAAPPLGRRPAFAWLNE